MIVVLQKLITFCPGYNLMLLLTIVWTNIDQIMQPHMTSLHNNGLGH